MIIINVFNNCTFNGNVFVGLSVIVIIFLVLKMRYVKKY